MDRFNFFFGFYSFILCLAVAEVLSGFAGYVRERRVRDLEPQTALLALVAFIDICATWLDAWITLKDIELDFGDLWAPILIATCFYLAAAMIFPRKSAELDNLGEYYRAKSWFVAAMLLSAELLIWTTFLPSYVNNFHHRPAVFWLWQVPLKLTLCGLWLALVLVHSRRANLAILAALLFLFVFPYWSNGGVPQWIHRHFDYPEVSARQIR